MKLPTKKLVFKAMEGNAWDYSNKVLYDICRKHPLHTEADKIIMKVLFIGRIYAAAIERRKNKEAVINDNFYLKKVVPLFLKTTLDQQLSFLKNTKLTKTEQYAFVLKLHAYLTKEIKRITMLEKRSFVSKYLHFHVPNMFFIYDSRASKALQIFGIAIPDDLKPVIQNMKVDTTYAKFYCKCIGLQREVKQTYGISLNTRELDSLLLQVANKIR